MEAIETKLNYKTKSLGAVRYQKISVSHQGDFIRMMSRIGWSYDQLLVGFCGNAVGGEDR